MSNLYKMKIMLVSSVFLLFFISWGSAETTDDIISKIKVDEIPKNLTVLEKWQEFEKKTKNLANYVVKLILPKLMESSGSMNISAQCMRDTMQLISGLKSIKPWALRLLDSSAKIIDGVLVGSLSNFGAYDECINTIATSSKSRDKGKMIFRGKYCTVDLAPPLPPKPNYYKLDEVLPELKNFSEGGTVVSEAAKYAHFFHFLSLRVGVCVPSGCTLDDVDKLAKLLENAMSVNAKVTRCELKEENEYTPIMIFVMCCFSFAGLLMLIGSLIDLYAYYKKVIYRNKCVRSLLAFSFFTNFQKFVDTKTTSGTLSCLNGIRFLCMSWIVLGHTYFIVNFQVFLGFEKAKDYARDFAFQAVTNATVAVDTFFFMGGLLVCYLTVKLVIIDGHAFSIRLYIFHRLWRILPVYVYVIMFMVLGNLLGSGPIWYDSTGKYLKACYDNWWTNIIFINNFYDAEHMCIPQSWYIASDFQLYVAALLIILPLIRWPKVGLSLTVLGIVASVVYAGVGTYINKYPPTMLFAHPDPDQRIDYWAHFYFRPFVHAGPYCMGILAGYLLATKPNLKIPRPILIIGWCVAFISSFCALYGPYEWNRGVDPKFWDTIFYASLCRVAWAFGVGWMIVCCCTGQGGVINYILSWKAFIPLGRLTFVVYLIHPVVQIVTMGNIRTRLQPDHFLAVWVYFGHLFVTYSTAFAGSMLIEAPSLALEKILIPKNQKKKTEESSLENDSNILKRTKDSSILKGTLHMEKNGDIAVIVPKVSEESSGIDNKAVVYKL